jgi:hypothetical protein
MIPDTRFLVVFGLLVTSVTGLGSADDIAGGMLVHNEYEAKIALPITRLPAKKGEMEFLRVEGDSSTKTGWRMISESPLIFEVDKFLTDAECDGERISLMESLQ